MKGSSFFMETYNNETLRYLICWFFGGWHCWGLKAPATQIEPEH